MPQLSRAQSLAALQGFYYAATGLWGIFGLRSFQAVTGPKTDLWLVRTVGVLVLASGLTMMAAATRAKGAGPVDPAVRFLAASEAAGFAAIEVLYTARGAISPVYLGDAAIELALVAAWATMGAPARRSAAASFASDARFLTAPASAAA
jgi:hypothetical protein